MTEFEILCLNMILQLELNKMLFFFILEHVFTQNELLERQYFELSTAKIKIGHINVRPM